MKPSEVAPDALPVGPANAAGRMRRRPRPASANSRSGRRRARPAPNCCSRYSPVEDPPVAGGERGRLGEPFVEAPLAAAWRLPRGWSRAGTGRCRAGPCAPRGRLRRLDLSLRRGRSAHRWRRVPTRVNRVLWRKSRTCSHSRARGHVAGRGAIDRRPRNAPARSAAVILARAPPPAGPSHPRRERRPRPSSSASRIRVSSRGADRRRSLAERPAERRPASLARCPPPAGVTEHQVALGLEQGRGDACPPTARPVPACRMPRLRPGSRRPAGRRLRSNRNRPSCRLPGGKRLPDRARGAPHGLRTPGSRPRCPWPPGSPDRRSSRPWPASRHRAGRPGRR